MVVVRYYTCEAVNMSSPFSFIPIAPEKGGGREGSKGLTPFHGAACSQLSTHLSPEPEERGGGGAGKLLKNKISLQLSFPQPGFLAGRLTGGEGREPVLQSS